jgi:hypothetical protein
MALLEGLDWDAYVARLQKLFMPILIINWQVRRDVRACRAVQRIERRTDLADTADPQLPVRRRPGIDRIHMLTVAPQLLAAQVPRPIHGKLWRSLDSLRLGAAGGGGSR